MLKKIFFLFFIMLVHIFQCQAAQVSPRLERRMLANQMEITSLEVVRNVLRFKLMRLRFVHNGWAPSTSTKGNEAASLQQLEDNLCKRIVEQLKKGEIKINDLNNEYFNNLILNNLPEWLLKTLDKARAWYRWSLSEYEKRLLDAFKQLKHDFYFKNVFWANFSLKLLDVFHCDGKFSDRIASKIVKEFKELTSFITERRHSLRAGEEEAILYHIGASFFDPPLNESIRNAMNRSRELTAAPILLEKIYGEIFVEHLNAVTKNLIMNNDLFFQEQSSGRFSVTIGDNVVEVDAAQIFQLWLAFNAARQKLFIFGTSINNDEKGVILQRILHDLANEIVVNRGEYSNGLVVKIVFKNLPQKFSSSILRRSLSLLGKTERLVTLAKRIKLARYDFFSTNEFMISKYFEFIDMKQKANYESLLRCLKFQILFESNEQNKEIMKMFINHMVSW